MTPEQTALYNQCAERADEIVSIAQAYIRDGVPINTAFRNCIATALYQTERDRPSDTSMHIVIAIIFHELNWAVRDRDIDRVARLLQAIRENVDPK